LSVQDAAEFLKQRRAKEYPSANPIMLKPRKHAMTIEERLDNLERELAAVKCRSRWIIGGGVIVTIVGCLLFQLTLISIRTVLHGTLNVNTLCAKMLTIEDDAGKTRAQINVTKNGPRLVMGDEKGTIRTLLTADGSGPGLALIDGNGTLRTTLGCSTNGPELTMNDDYGMTRTGLTVDKDQNPRFYMRDDHGKLRTQMRVDKTAAGLSVMDANGKARAGITVGRDGPAVTLIDQNGKTRAAMSMDKDAAGMFIMDTNGRPVWAVP